MPRQDITERMRFVGNVLASMVDDARNDMHRDALLTATQWLRQSVAEQENAKDRNPFSA